MTLKFHTAASELGFHNGTQIAALHYSHSHSRFPKHRNPHYRDQEVKREGPDGGVWALRAQPEVQERVFVIVIVFLCVRLRGKEVMREKTRMRMSEGVFCCCGAEFGLRLIKEKEEEEEEAASCYCS